MTYPREGTVLVTDLGQAWAASTGGLPLPLGVSFVTFTLTAYIVDVYRRRFLERPSASTVLAYVLFFPHLIAGPILRGAQEHGLARCRPRGVLRARDQHAPWHRPAVAGTTGRLVRHNLIVAP